MKALIYQKFNDPIELSNVNDPKPPDFGVTIKVTATGLCRSDWHGWKGHDPDIRLPHVPGHELAGEILEVGRQVRKWKAGQRVTTPFVCGCGNCPQCISGNHQICDFQSQPGFTHWGSFAEVVAVDYADVNLVELPETIDSVTAASLGCRFVTSFRAVVDQARVSAGEFVVIHGCGGVGLSAIMIAKAVGAQVIAVDINAEALSLAGSLGADHLVSTQVVEAIQEITKGGAHVSIDALGSAQTSFNSVSCLRKQGRHVQVGLMVADDKNSPLPMDKVIADELVLMGSHGMQAYRYPEMLEMIRSGILLPDKLIGKRIRLSEAGEALIQMDKFESRGITVIDRFD